MVVEVTEIKYCSLSKGFKIIALHSSRQFVVTLETVSAAKSESLVFIAKQLNCIALLVKI